MVMKFLKMDIYMCLPLGLKKTLYLRIYMLTLLIPIVILI